MHLKLYTHQIQKCWPECKDLLLLIFISEPTRSVYIMKYHVEVIKVNNHKKRFTCLLIYFVDAHICAYHCDVTATGRSWAVL